MENIGLRFVRWGAGLLVLGLLTGYRILNALVDGFYYRPVTSMLNLWLSIDGIFLSLYGVGCLLFLSAPLRSTRYAPTATPIPEQPRPLPESR